MRALLGSPLPLLTLVALDAAAKPALATEPVDGVPLIQLKPGQQTSPSPSGNAVTMWWAIFNAPSECRTDPDSTDNRRCGERDIFGDAFLESVAAGRPDASLIEANSQARVGVIYATGGFVERGGRVRLVASLYETHAPLVLDLRMDPLDLGTGLWSAEKAEVHVIVRDHGSALMQDDGYIAQITNFLDPYCEDPLLGFIGDLSDGSRRCVDIRAALFAPNVSGRAPVWRLPMTDPPVQATSAEARLLRRGESLTATVEMGRGSWHGEGAA